jgi:hypothetical protein
VNRWVGLAVVAVLLVVGWLGYFRPELFPGQIDMAQLSYLLMALLLVSGAGYGFQRFRLEGGRVLVSLLFWAALIAGIAFVYTLFN